MGYRAGIGGALASLVLPPELAASTPSEPHVFCDGCGITHGVGSRSAYAAAWFLARKPPPGWRGCRKHDGSLRVDLCPRCWKEPEQETP